MKEIIKTNKQPLVSGWSVGTDPDNIGKDSGYPLSPTESARPAEVPSAIQERFPEYCGVAWYWCRFDCLIGGGDRLILRFGVVDYMAEVWLNGSCLGSYEGGETAFEFDVTDSIRKTGENLLAVRVINTCGKDIDGIHDIGPSLIGAGDVHCYPTSPHDEHTYDYLMKVGTGMRPVIISEYGIGTNFNVIHEARMFEQYGADPDLCDYKWVREQSEGLKRDFSKFGFDRVYPFPETMLIESQRLGARQRTLGFNLIRANPHIAGFSMTGLLDHGMCGEGLWSYWRRWKPEMFDAISDGFSPLRFCLMTWQTNAYSGREFRVKASLATEDALRPGRYSASFRIVRDCVTVWSKDTEIVIPGSMPLAVPVFDEKITLDVPTGKYTLLANLNNGGSPTGEKLDFYITDTSYLNAQGTSVRVWGVNEKAAAFMTSCGVNVLPFSGETDLPVIVGNPEDHGDDAKWNSLRTAAENGHKTVFMQSRLFLDHPELTAKTGFADFRCVYTQDFLYHKEYVPMPHPIFDGLRPGMMDLDYVSTVFPHETIETEASPEPICSGFVTGSIWVEGAYRSSYSIAEWKTGRGSVILSMPYVLENIGDNPIADILLINTVKYINR
ncbi:beta-galactosidase/beta-glucuronidase [Candidatus Colimorpha enterica]|uniref:Beta-galactosidase/beta-glucuronidase n=1 Tax=Candidatus Colimorpha enterica TaxID=3083063 RepID=R6TTZ5_9BACT|nr:beta-galactosidase/beta-glucuronidase [Candidatus Colimorpha enterica]